MAGAIGQKAEKEEGKNVYSVGGEGKKNYISSGVKWFFY